MQIPFIALPPHWLSSEIKFINLFAIMPVVETTTIAMGSFLSIQVRICNQMNFLQLFLKFSF